MADELTDKQALFVQYYLEDMNATRAAKKAGYSAKTARQMGSENLSKPDIRAAIEKELERRVMSRSEVLTRLGDQARADMRDLIGLSPKQLKRHPDGRLIKKIEHTIVKITDTIAEEKIKIELYDAQAALVHLGKYHALFVERQRVETWEDEAIRLIRDKVNPLPFHVLAEEIGREDAERLFKRAGVSIPDEGQDTAGSE